MDKSWIKMHRNEEGFREGVISFLDFAFERIQPGLESIRCPCVYCNNNCCCPRDEVHLHILRHGFTKGYTNWIYHGEAVGREPLITARTIEDDLPENDDWDELLGAIGAASDSDPANFYRLLEESEQPLYPDCKLLKEIKVPDGYASNISRCVNLKERRLIGLKSHDCHVLLEHLLPIAIRGNLPDDVCEAVTELCMFFKVLCATVLNMADLDKLQDSIAITLCKLERIFPPSFFVVMMHLPIHLVEQAKVGGPVQYRWMYPVERYLRKLKCYVRNKAHPEGSMAKGQIIEESLVLIDRHMNSVVTKFNQLGRNEDNTRFQSADNKLSIFRQSGEFHGKKRVASFSEEEFQLMKMAVLKNCDEVHQYEDEHKAMLEGTSHAHRKHTQEFPRWFEHKIYQLHKDTSQVSDELISLSGGPCREALSFNIYTVNGYRFQTKRWEQGRTTQNAGVCVTIEKDYFGVLTDIIELRYVGGFRVVLFKCDWRDVDTDRGCRKDKHGAVTAVNKTISCWQDEPYVLPSQVSQVMYVNEGEESQWQTVIKLKPRNYYDMPVRDINTELSPSEAAQDLYSAFSMEDLQRELPQDDDDNFVWGRCDVPEETVTYVAPEQGRGKAVDQDDADIESVYTTSDDDDLLEFEESDNEMDWD